MDLAQDGLSNQERKILMRCLFAWPCIPAILLGLWLSLPVSAAGCPLPGQWLAPGGEPLESAKLMQELAQQDVVLLGEQHDRMDHHRWQLHMLAGLHALRPELVIGLEMLPREAQPALDAWVAGEFDEPAFLDASEWYKAWGFDPELYLPILHFARLHQVPLKALNVTPELRGRLVEEGWEAMAVEERFGITAPAAALPAYREQLAAIHAEHPMGSMGESEAGLERFIAAQLVWDRAMATGLAQATHENELVVGLMGQGHLQYGHGVPYQLDDLGVEAHATLLPWDVTGPECEPPPDGLARALFVLGETPAPIHPRAQLGVYLQPDEQGVAVHEVMQDSVAQAAGLEAGDIIQRAAGKSLVRTDELVRIVQRQPPGTLLPLDILRDGHEREVLVRFPASPEG